MRQLTDKSGQPVECDCGGEVKYDTDCCGHEWLDCLKCKRHLETYQSADIFNAWEEVIARSNDDETIVKEAITEQRNYAVAHCPYCGAEHDVSTCDSGEIVCICNKKFAWSTVD